jgi:hypothetical protein
MSYSRTRSRSQRPQKISIALKYERKYLVFLSSSKKWSFPTIFLSDKSNIESITDFLNEMNIDDYDKPIYSSTKYNTKIYVCDIYKMPNISYPSYKWLNEREIMKLDNTESNTILKSFLKKNTKNVRNKKKMELKPTKLEKHDYESVKSIIEKRNYEECEESEECKECNYETVKSVLEFLELEKFDKDNKFKYSEYDCETVKSVLDFLEM